MRPIEYTEIARFESPVLIGQPNLLRVVVLDGKIFIFTNNLNTDVAVDINLTRENVVELGKALLEAWQIAS